MNSVILIGRLARDPELRYTPNSQTAVAHFTLAVDRERGQQGGERQTDFLRITVFGRQAETVDRFLKKGSQCAVQGRIETSSYQNRDGQTVYSTDIIANRVEFLGSRQNGQGGQGYGEGNQSYGGGQGYNRNQGGQSYGGGNQNYGGNQSYGNQGFSDQGFGANDDPFGMDLPDSFQAAEDDIPF